MKNLLKKSKSALWWYEDDKKLVNDGTLPTGLVGDATGLVGDVNDCDISALVANSIGD